jgi:hypothetical protein
MAGSDAKQRENASGSHRGKKDADAAIIAALIMGSSQQDAARHSGTSLKTVQRRLASPHFQKRLAEARQEVVRQGVDRASFYGNMALNTLMRLMDSENLPVALGAARSLLEVAFRMKESASFEERLAAIEDELDEQPKPRRMTA